MAEFVCVVSRSLLREAYDLVLAEWPDVIEPGDKTFHLNGGCQMRAFNDTYFPIHEWACHADFSPEIDEIIGSVDFFVHQAMQSALRDLTRLRKADLDFEAFVSRFDSHPNFRVVSDTDAVPSN